MPKAILEDRAVLFIEGDDARPFLQGLVTADIEKTTAETTLFSALLSPQGKIQFDFFITPHEQGFYVDIDKERVTDFLKCLALYRLRSKVTFTNLSEEKSVFAVWGEEDTLCVDSRLNTLGSRLIIDKSEQGNASSNDYHIHRIKLGVPEAGKDFAYDSIFPHDAMMDCLGGIDFKKGCYIGQEVVSRVEHRSTARKRFFKVKANETFNESNFADILLDDKIVGTMGSFHDREGLALLRMDRIKGDQSLKINDTLLKASLPDYFTAYLAVKNA